MQAREVRDHLLSLGRGWVDPSATWDVFHAGDPATEVRGIAVGWMSYTWALQRAIDLGCNLFVTHEPTFYGDDSTRPELQRLEGVARKRAWIERAGIAVLRCHDVWDQVKGIGVPDTWAALLGFSDPIHVEGYHRVFDAGGLPAGDLARRVAERTRPLGQEAVQLVGDPAKPVRRVALGTGAITPFLDYATRLSADAAIVSDDGIRFWRDGAYALDAGIPMVVVNHAVSEEAASAALARHLAERFAAVPVRHIPQRCMYTLVRGG